MENKFSSKGAHSAGLVALLKKITGTSCFAKGREKSSFHALS